MFETYLVNIINDFNSPDVLAHFQEADSTHIVWVKIWYTQIFKLSQLL